MRPSRAQAGSESPPPPSNLPYLPASLIRNFTIGPGRSPAPSARESSKGSLVSRAASTAEREWLIRVFLELPAVGRRRRWLVFLVLCPLSAIDRWPPLFLFGDLTAPLEGRTASQQPAGLFTRFYDNDCLLDIVLIFIISIYLLFWWICQKYIIMYTCFTPSVFQLTVKANSLLIIVFNRAYYEQFFQYIFIYFRHALLYFRTFPLSCNCHYLVNQTCLRFWKWRLLKLLAVHFKMTSRTNALAWLESIER